MNFGTLQVEEQLPLSKFSEKALGQDGHLHLTDNIEGTLKRDTMHNRVSADVFLPCGGRPGIQTPIIYV